MSDRAAVQSMAQQKARCLIFNGSVWRAVQAPPANPPSPLKALNPLPAPAIVCRLLPLYSPLLSASLVTINGYFALKKRPLQKIPQIFRPTTLEMLIMKKMGNFSTFLNWKMGNFSTFLNWKIEVVPDFKFHSYLIWRRF